VVLISTITFASSFLHQIYPGTPPSSEVLFLPYTFDGPSSHVSVGFPPSGEGTSLLFNPPWFSAVGCPRDSNLALFFSSPTSLLAIVPSFRLASCQFGAISPPSYFPLFQPSRWLFRPGLRASCIFSFMEASLSIFPGHLIPPYHSHALPPLPFRIMLIYGSLPQTSLTAV